MTAFSRVMTTFFDGLLRPLAGAHPYYGLTVISAVTGFLMLIIFKYCSHQGAMKSAKEKIKAHFFEVLLYRDDLRVLLGIQKNLLIQNGRYSLQALLPALVMIPPVVILLVQMDLRFAHRALRPGERAIVAVTLVDRIPGEELEIALEAPPGIEVETPALRIRDAMEADWRIRAVREGRYELTVRLGSESVQKEVVVGGEGEKVVSRIRRASFRESLLNPGEPSLGAASLAREIQVKYPPYRFPAGHYQLHWLVPFCVVSLAVGFGLKPVFHVE